MARRKRIDYPGAWHHVMGRGARREPIFRDPDHCGMFLDRVGFVVRRFGLEVHAYVLMPNHYHLLVRSVQGNLSLCMQQLLGPYTQALNQKHDWDGPVFRGRFANQLVSESEHLQVLVPYMHLNPVRARLATAPQFAFWSSYTDYLGISGRPEWLSTDVVMGMYGTLEQLETETMAYHRGEVAWPLDFDVRRGIFTSWPAGVPFTVEEKAAHDAGQAEYVQQLFTTVTGRPWSDVSIARRGRRSNPARRFAVWLMLRETDFPHKTIARQVGATRDQVTQMVHQLRKANFESPLDHWVRRAEIWGCEHPRKPGR